jgi:hypothetical protein
MSPDISLFLAYAALFTIAVVPWAILITLIALSCTIDSIKDRILTEHIYTDDPDDDPDEIDDPPRELIDLDAERRARRVA